METLQNKILDICYDSAKYSNSETECWNKITRKLLQLIEDENSKLLMFESCRKALRDETKRREELELLFTFIVDNPNNHFCKTSMNKMYEYIKRYKSA